MATSIDIIPATVPITVVQGNSIDTTVTVTIDGVAVDPVVLVSGSGSAHVAKYRGQSRVQSTGSGTARVGD
jgi:hypothetical protein